MKTWIQASDVYNSHTTLHLVYFANVGITPWEFDIHWGGGLTPHPPPPKKKIPRRTSSANLHLLDIIELKFPRPFFVKSKNKNENDIEIEVHNINFYVRLRPLPE